ncbi:MAG: hypothetical protein K6V36_14210 [Anaerolineae bacterium]|nr:hypothetical protein [Anaerolineae bacterium]
MSRRADQLSGRPLWWRWTLATAAGAFVGFAVPGAVGSVALLALEGLAPIPHALATLAILALAGVVEGAALGYAQWLILRHTLPAIAARAWALPTAVAAGIAYVLGLLPSTLSDLGASFGAILPASVLAAFLLLVSIGFAQWLTLRHHVPRAAWWILANATAWVAGLTVPIAAVAFVPDGSPTFAYIAAGVVSGWIMGLVVGAITGVALVRLVRTVNTSD